MASTIADRIARRSSTAAWSQHQPEHPRSKIIQARPQAAVRSGHIRRAISDDRTRVRVGRQVPATATSFRSPQSAALRIQDPGLHNDQSPALLPGLIYRPAVGHCRFTHGALRRDQACTLYARGRAPARLRSPNPPRWNKNRSSSCHPCRVLVSCCELLTRHCRSDKTRYQ
jgi:hypothetical protein